MKKYAVILSSLAFLLTACASAPADSVSATPVPTETPAPTAEPTPEPTATPSPTPAPTMAGRCGLHDAGLHVQRTA